MSIFRQVNFSKVYAGNLDNASKHYVNWFAEFEDQNATTSLNSIAYGLYSEYGFTQCKQIGNTGDNFSRIDENNNQLSLNFKPIHRKSNFLIPVFLGLEDGNENNITITKLQSAETNEDAAAYSLTVSPINRGNYDLSQFNLTNEIAQLFILHSFIITNINQDTFKSFSIFNNNNGISQYYQPEESSNSYTLNVFFNNNVSGDNSIKTFQFGTNQTPEFYRYNLPYGEQSNSNIIPTLEKVEINNSTDLIREIKLGTLYIAKKSIQSIEYSNDKIADSIIHPLYTIGKLKLEYYNAKRTAIIQEVELDVKAQTNQLITFNTFSSIARYQFNNKNSLSVEGSAKFLTCDSTQSPVYYAGGTLIGWTTNENAYFNNNNNTVQLLTENDNIPNESTENYYQHNTNIIPSKFYQYFYYNGNSSNNSYFYFSNQEQCEPDLSTINSNFITLTKKLYPVYKVDRYYNPPVVEVTTEEKADPTDDDYITLTRGALKTLSVYAKYPKVSGSSTTSSSDWAASHRHVAVTEITTDAETGIATTSTQYIQVGSEIKFQNLNGTQLAPVDTSQSPSWNSGTFRVNIDDTLYEVPINGLGGSGSGINIGDLTINGKITGNLIPSASATYNIGSDNYKWKDLYLSGTAYIGTQVSVSGTADGIQNTTNNGQSLPTTISGNTNASIYTAGGICAAQNIYGLRVFNAVFNDYAECRTTIDLTPGHVVIDNDDGSLSCTSARLQPGAQVISDTYGHLMGSTENTQTPIAVAGRVLVYPHQDRNNYHAGMAVCSAPNGTVDIMTREEIKEYPDCIIGIVSEIPEYETWGSNNVKVDGRIWIKVK